MGVMPCSREGCREIMCHLRVLLPEGGRYICVDCLRELRDHYRRTWPGSMTEVEVRDRVRAFMYSPPGTHLPDNNLDPAGIDAELDRLIRGD